MTLVTKKSMKSKMIELLENIHNTTPSKFKYQKIKLMWLYFSGTIINWIGDDNGNNGDGKDLQSTADLAFYKDGKALKALCPEWKNYAERVAC